MLETHSRALSTTSVRSILQTVARIIAADRRPVVLATEKGAVLLANAPANRLGFDEDGLGDAFDWHNLCSRAHRAGSIPVSTSHQGATLEGEIIYLPLGEADAFMLRLAENDEEATILRNRARTATLMRVSHDLRTPIQSLLATTEAVFQDSGAAAASASQSHEKMHRVAKQTLEHIDNVLRVIQGELTLSDLQTDKEFNLSEELEAIIHMVEPLAKARGATLTSTDDCKGAARVIGPVRFVRALLQNVVDNSVKHGGKEITVRLECTPQEFRFEAGLSRPGVAVFIEVADLGGGLPPEQKARLQRALGHTELAEGRAGQGAVKPDKRPSAGLNIMAHALRQLGGDMKILDRGASGNAVLDGGEEIVGTILRIRFSLASVTGDAPPEAASPPSPAIPMGTILSGVGVLVVEDSPASRDWLAHTLRAAGADVQAVENGIKALKILHQPELAKRIHLLLSDITLPHMSGVELVRRINSAQVAGELGWSGVKIGLTAHVDNELRTLCLNSGMARVLEKPIRGLQLCHAVRDVLNSGSSVTGTQAEADKQQVRKSDMVRDSPEGSGLDDAALAALIEQLGLQGAQGFMRRALAEAQTVWRDIDKNGIHGDSGRRLHAATGACGLTGLKAVERRLRALELLLESTNADLAAPLLDLRDALVETEAAINTLSEDSQPAGTLPAK